MTTNTINTTVIAAIFSTEGLLALQESVTALCAKAEKFKVNNPGTAMPVTKDAVLLHALNSMGVELSEEEAPAVLEATREVVTSLITLGAFPGYVLKRGQWGGIQREGFVAPEKAKGEKKTVNTVSAAQRLAKLCFQFGGEAVECRG